MEHRINLTTIFIALIFVGNLVGSFCKIAGIPFISTFIVYVEFFAILYMFWIFIKNPCYRCFNMETRQLIVYYFIYSLFCFNYIFVNPQVPRLEMQGVYPDNFKLLQSFLICSLPLFVTRVINDKIDYQTFAKIIAIVTVVIFPVYFLVVDPITYIMYCNLEITTEELGELNIIGPFAVAHYAGYGIIAGVYLYGKWSSQKYINILMTIVVIGINLVVISVAGKRGPILFLLFVLLIYIYSKVIVKSQLLLMALFILAVIIYVYSDYIFFFLEEIAPSITHRFMRTVDDGGSDRVGTDDSIYSLALEQISESWAIGSYFRLLSTKSYTFGYYPHNIILEVLMTTGIFISLLFFYCVVAVLRKSIVIIKTNGSASFLVLLFIYILLMFLTSDSLFSKAVFWIPFAIIANISYKNYYE